MAGDWYFHLRSQGTFVVSCFKFLKPFILKTIFSWIVLVFFFSWRIHSNLLDVDCRNKFTWNVFLGWVVRYCKLLAETTHKECFFSYFFSLCLLANYSWNNRRNGWVFVYELSGCGFESRCCYLIGCPSFWQCLMILKGLIFIFICVVLDQTYSSENKKLLTTRRNTDTLVCSSVSWTSVENAKANAQAVLKLELGKLVFTYFVSSSLLKFSWHFSFNFATLATRTSSFCRRNACDVIVLILVCNAPILLKQKIK